MKTAKILMLIGFLLNVLFLIYSISAQRTFIALLSGFSQEKLVLSLIVPALEILATAMAFILLLKFKKKEKEGQIVKYSKTLGGVFILLAPILFYLSCFVSLSFIYNLSNIPADQSWQNQDNLNQSNIPLNPSSSIKQITPDEVKNLSK